MCANVALKDERKEVGSNAMPCALWCGRLNGISLLMI